MMRRAGEIRIGLSGWSYKPWRGHFYPPKHPYKRELAYAASVFNSIEVNGTFYSLQRPETFRSWSGQVPDGFVFALKGPRFITHIKRLKDARGALANFFASGPLALGAGLGPFLWQLPPNFRFDADLLAAFFDLLPRSTAAAARLARGHDARFRDRVWVETDADRPLRHALEIRHDSFRDAAFIALLRRHGIALVCADTVDWPLLMDLTADFVYCRLHGSGELYRSRYSEAALRRWAERARAWSEGRPMADGDFAGRTQGRARKRDVFLFFDNTDKLHAPDNAQSMMRHTGLVWRPPPVERETRPGRSGEHADPVGRGRTASTKGPAGHTRHRGPHHR